MTKTEYRQYISSEGWQQRRKEYLEGITACNRCWLPRWCCALTYDQDLHVHHKSYANLGVETDEQLEALCRRCHDLETFGRSNFRQLTTAICEACKRTHFNPYSIFCPPCLAATGWITEESVDWEAEDPTEQGKLIWQVAFRRIKNAITDNFPSQDLWKELMFAELARMEDEDSRFRYYMEHGEWPK